MENLNQETGNTEFIEQMTETRRPVARKITESILTVLVLQIIIGGAIGALSNTIVKMGFLSSEAVLMVSNYIAGPLSVLISWKLYKVIDLRATFEKGKTFVASNRYSIVAALIGAIACTLFGNILTDMVGAPDELEDKFESLMRNAVGIPYICIIGPIVEELIFREGIIGFMQRNGRNARMSIGVSAILFGLIHINPAQVVFAMIMGVALGVLYWKTRNIWLCGIAHIINNSTAAVENWTLPKEIRDMSFAEMLGSQALAITCMIAFGLLSWLLLKYFWNTYRDC